MGSEIQFKTKRTMFDKVFLITVIVAYSLVTIGFIAKATGLWMGF